jgi:hypothetical protein
VRSFLLFSIAADFEGTGLKLLGMKILRYEKELGMSLKVLVRVFRKG